MFEQAIYAKTIELKWKDQGKFNSGVWMMAIFHILMFMHILSKRSADAEMIFLHIVVP